MACPWCGRLLPRETLTARPCDTCAGRDRRARAWANAAGPELLDMAVAIGVGATFCREGRLPSYDDTGLAEQIADRPLPKGGLLIVGPVGTHKTHFLCARAVDAARRGWAARILKWPVFLMEVRATYGERATRTDLELIRQYAGLDFLGVDDLAIGRLEARESEHAVRLAYDMFDARYESGRVTDITTNALPGELAARFDERIARRLAELTTVYPMLVLGEQS